MSADVDSSDVCGAECADGTPCQHPSGSCPVPDHEDTDDEGDGPSWRYQVRCPDCEFSRTTKLEANALARQKSGCPTVTVASASRWSGPIRTSRF
jgi:hypothetical protein